MTEKGIVRPLLTILEENRGGRGETLCFDPSEFLKEHFSVDEFLRKHRKVESLELLCDDLGLYLKNLRSSMIDLINEDYEDFVNLSANLVGLDQLILSICSPLEKLRNEVIGINEFAERQIIQIREIFQEKEVVNKFRRSMENLKSVFIIAEKLTDLLNRKLEDENNLQAVDLERACLYLIKLNFGVQNCELYLSKGHQDQVAQLNQRVYHKLRLFFNNALKHAKHSNSEELERCLRIYMTLGACDVAECVFKDDVVAPYMADIITEQQLQNSPQGITGIYTKILNFISLHMTDILRLTQYSNKLQGFKFIINSFWSEVEMRLEVNMSSIFAPGNSELFFIKYKCSRDFLYKIEELFASSDLNEVRHFREHKQTKSFKKRWNLPVYFQICFQEIAGEFEAQLEPIISDNIAPSGSESYSFAAFNAVEKAIKRCWSDGVYLREIFPKFYKLSIQIIMRLCRWVTDLLENVKSQAYKHSHSKIDLLALLYVDLNNFLESLPNLKELLKSKAKPNIYKSIEDSFEIAKSVLQQKLINIQNIEQELLIAESGGMNIRQVNDLPRLYRKTNRGVPTRSSAYVEQMLFPLKSFSNQYSLSIKSEVIESILVNVCNAITEEYFEAVKGVLTSVQKTEESLRRLRNFKIGNQPQTTSTTGVTDDDKIRLQLRVDVTSWTNEMSRLIAAHDKVEKLSELNDLVKEKVKIKDENTMQ